MSNTAPSNKPDFPRIALTPGEPAGIGPDIAIMLAEVTSAAAIVHFADPHLIAERAAALRRPIRILEIDRPEDAEPQAAGVLQIVPVTTATMPKAGTLDPANAAYVLTCLDAALDACTSGITAALVTGPVNKAVINDAGMAFSGHTEYLAARLDAALPVMLLVAGDLRVALVTTHVPLRQVPALITQSLVDAVIEIVHRELDQKFGIRSPCIGVCGLNPHAGEQGHLGHEERDVIAPAVAALRARGLDVRGPLPADTAFTREQRKCFDVIVAMYHDQGLSALKALSFGDAVNVTLGLPVVRTSVDHGTAIDCAATGNADPASLRAALALAIKLGATARAPG